MRYMRYKGRDHGIGIRALLFFVKRWGSQENRLEKNFFLLYVGRRFDALGFFFFGIAGLFLFPHFLFICFLGYP